MTEPITPAPLTKDERVALLLEWELIMEEPWRECRTYRHKDHGTCRYKYVSEYGNGPDEWPFHDSEKLESTVKAVEAKIIAEGLADAYMATLYYGNQACRPAQPWRWASSAWVLLTATPALKIDAALAVWEARTK